MLWPDFSDWLLAAAIFLDACAAFAALIRLVSTSQASVRRTHAAPTPLAVIVQGALPLERQHDTSIT